MTPIRRALLLALAATLAAPALPAQQWPSFRGRFARGVADDQNLPLRWNVGRGENIRWRAPIPGMGHSSPVVWGDLIFVTTAVSGADDQLVLGDSGGISLARDERLHSWRLYALDKTDGEVIWFREAFSGVPRAARHVKASQSNATPATDGRTVVAIFGSQGIAAYDLSGRELWKKDLGKLDPGLFGDPTSEWGYASSPIIFGDKVIVQVDRHADSFLAALSLADGERVWSVARDEKPVWSSPTVHESAERSELIVAGGDFDRGYDPESGAELWRFARDLQVKTPTPFVAGELIILAGGYRGKPLWAVRVGARGDVSLPEGKTSSDWVAWTSDEGGPYTSTPVAYGDKLFFVRDIGVFTVLSLATGERLHQQRLASTFSASAVASDGRIYLAGEDGMVYVVEASGDFEVLASNDMGEPCMATPAISDGSLFVRTRGHLYAIGNTDDS